VHCWFRYELPKQFNMRQGKNAQSARAFLFSCLEGEHCTRNRIRISFLVELHMLFTAIARFLVSCVEGERDFYSHVKGKSIAHVLLVVY